MTTSFTVGPRLIALLPSALQDRVVRNLGWYGAGEAAARLSRLATTILLARSLGTVELGTAAIAITCFELMRVLTNGGIGQFVAHASAARLDAVCNTAYRAAFASCILTAIFQVAVAAGVGYALRRADIFLMIACLAGVYIIMIPGLVPAYLLVREGRIKAIAGVSTTQVVIDNILTAVFAGIGLGAWSIVLPKLLTAPVWLVGVRYNKSWRAEVTVDPAPMRELMQFALPVLGSEILAAVRLNLDNLIVWSLIGVDALGIYYFVFNAGIGFSLSLTSALSCSLYPELAAIASRPASMLKRFDDTVKKIALPICLVILVQAAACFGYVPLVFGGRWAFATPLVAILCFSAVSKPLFDSACQLLRAAKLPGLETVGASLFTFAALGTLAVSAPYGLETAVTVYAFALFALQATFFGWARREVGRR